MEEHEDGTVSVYELNVLDEDHFLLGYVRGVAEFYETNLKD